jgi:hypothetical protein
MSAATRKTPMTGENLRRHPRKTIRLPARLDLEGDPLEGRIENIGEGGAFFVTDTLEGSVEEGDILHLEFELEGAAHRPAGIVLRVERYFHEGELFRAFAIKFEEPFTPPAEPA